MAIELKGALTPSKAAPGKGRLSLELVNTYARPLEQFELGLRFMRGGAEVALHEERIEVLQNGKTVLERPIDLVGELYDRLEVGVFPGRWQGRKDWIDPAEIAVAAEGFGLDERAIDVFTVPPEEEPAPREPKSNFWLIIVLVVIAIPLYRSCQGPSAAVKRSCREACRQGGYFGGADDCYRDCLKNLPGTLEKIEDAARSMNLH